MTSATAGANLIVSLSISQTRFGAPTFTDTKSPEAIYDTRLEKSADESSGRIDVGGLDLRWVVASDQPFPVVGLNPLVITVELWLTVECRRAQSLLDLYEKDFQANVPGVVLTLS